jgi:hypothetical protein
MEIQASTLHIQNLCEKPARVRTGNLKDQPNPLTSSLGKRKRNKGVRYVGARAQLLKGKKEQGEDQILPAKYPGEIDIQGTDYAPYPRRVQQGKLGFGDVRKYDPTHLVREHETPGAQKRHQRVGVDDRRIFHVWVR